MWVYKYTVRPMDGMGQRWSAERTVFGRVVSFGPLSVFVLDHGAQEFWTVARMGVTTLDL